MSEENKDANIAAESSSEAKLEAEGQTPEAANALPKAEGEKESTEQIPFHKHPRWQEMMDERKRERAELSDLHQKLAGLESKKEDPQEVVIRDYVKAGMKEDAARLLVKGQFDLARKAADERVAPIERETLASKNELVFSRFSETHKDYEELKPRMGEMYAGMTEQAKAWVSASPEGLQYLYDRVKSEKLDSKIQEAFNKGVQEGYKRKQEKSAVAPSSGGSANLPKGSFTEEDIQKMPLEEYKKNQKDILASRGMR